MRKLLNLMASSVLFGIAGITGCGKVVEAAPSAVSGVLSIMPTPVTLALDQTVNLAAIITTEPQSIEDVTQTAVWESSSSSGLLIKNGNAICRQVGIYKVTVSTLALSQSAAVTCNAPLKIPPPPTAPNPPPPPTAPNPPSPPTPELTGIAIVNVPSFVRSNAPPTLSVQGTHTDNSTSNVTTQVSWNGDSVANVSSKGVVYCNTAGKATIRATVGTHTSTAVLQCFMKQVTGAPGFVEHAAKFFGPFQSWLNAKDFGAKGNGVADDTQALQTAITAAITQSRTLWIPTGSYKISNTLQVLKSDGLSIIGEDPRNTTIFWRGAVGGQIISFDGSSHFRTTRINWDCKNHLAGTGIHIASTLMDGQLYPTYDAIEDSKLTQCDIGILPEFAGETTVNRVHFDQNTYGINLGNWNALNFNVTDSLFTDNAVGVSNYAFAGAFNISNSVFVRSTVADLQMGNTQAFAIRHNLSVGSNMFFYVGPINSGAAVTIEGNTIIDTKDVPIIYGNQGTVSLIDNTFDMPSKPQRPVLVAADWKTAYVLAIGNVYTTATPYVAQAGSFINVTIYDEAAQSTLPASEWSIPTEVYIPPASTSPVIEAPAGGTSDDLQNAVNDAARILGGAIVHLPNSSYSINTVVDVPDSPGLAIVGDGQNTDLRHGPMLLGPVLRTHGSVELDGLFISGSSISSSIEVLVDDQPSTRILCDSCTTVSTKQSMLVSKLDHATINTRTSTLNGDKGVTLTGGANQSNNRQTLGRMDAFMTVSDTYNISHGGHFLISDGWHDGGQSPIQAIVSDNSMVTEEGSSICVASPKGVQAVGFTGQLSLVGDQVNTAVTADPASTGSLGMIGSITGPWNDKDPSTQFAINGSKLSTVHGGDTIINFDGIGSATNTVSAAADIERALSQSRTEFVVPRKTLAIPATLVRIHRVMAGDGAVGMKFSSNQAATDGGMYKLADPSGRTDSITCSTDTMALDGAWSLISGGDGFYGLLRGSSYLANVIDVNSGAGTLRTMAAMTDAGQRWLIQPVGDGLFQVVNRADGSYLTRTASGCATVSMASAELNQEWAVTAQ